MVGSGVRSGWIQWRKRALAAGIATAATICLSATTIGTLPVAALGLGEIDTQSALNERFSAEIELLDTRGLDAGEVLASLASSDDFRRVGVERFFFLTNLQFDVTRNARGNLVINATSQQPITEPYLNFLVEVLWPSGRLLKEYTVLLDPPTFTHSAAAPVAAPSREQTDVSSAGRIQRDTGQASVPSQPRAATSAGRNRVNSSDNTYGRTTRSDTMWAIASQTLPSSDVTPQQNMLAIQRLNPDAFIDGNVNLLKRGVVLRLPNEGEAAALSQSAAIAQVREQTQAWRNGAPGRAVAAANAESQSVNPTQDSATIDATTRGPGSVSTQPAATDGRLRIVATETTGPVDSIKNASSNEGATAVAGDPAAQERLAELNRQVDELTYQLDLQKRGVEQQISERDNTINLKDQRIAQLEQQLKTLRENANNVQQSTPQSAAAAGAEADTPWWQQTAVLGGVLGLLAVGLMGVLFSRRRNNTDDLELDDLEPDATSFELGESALAAEATPLGGADLVGDLEDADAALGVDPELGELEEAAAAAEADVDELSDDELFGPADDATPEPAASADSAQTSDVIGEADIYIAYGRYPQAIALLQGAVEANPEDHAVRMRLLEVSAETEDVESYVTHASALREHCNDADTLNAANKLHESLDTDLRDQIDAFGGQSGDSASTGGLAKLGPAAAGTALAAGAASVFGKSDDSLEDDIFSGGDSLDNTLTDAVDDVQDTAEAEPFAFDTTVTDVAGDDLVDDDAIDSSLEDLAAELPDSDDAEGEFELDLDLDTEVSADADVQTLTDEIADDAVADFDQPAVNTDQFSTNVDIATADDVAADEFNLDLDVQDTGAEMASLDVDMDNLEDDLGLDFPDEASELERVVAETDDDQLLDEIERSLDELETDGLLSPELSDDGDFSFDDDADTSATKLDLARAYIDMGDDDGAREILSEVVTEGDTSQKGEASELLDKL